MKSYYLFMLQWIWLQLTPRERAEFVLRNCGRESKSTFDYAWKES